MGACVTKERVNTCQYKPLSLKDVVDKNPKLNIILDNK